MNTTLTHLLLSAAVAAVLASAGTASAQATRFEALSSLPFAENRPTQETAQTLRDELLFQRATQTYLWALPLVNTLGMKVGSEKLSAPATTFSRSGRNASTPRPW